MDTAVNSGNSGGGLFNNRGELIGIVNAKLNNSEGMNYAIPSNFVKCVADNILYYCDGTNLEGVYRCYLGINVSANRLYTEYDKELGVVYKREEVAVAVVDNEGLAKDVLQVGDIINTITIDGVEHRVTRMYIVTDAMLSAKVGSTVVMNVTRAGVTFDVSVTITESALTQVK